jgi:hypothetical protein
MIDHSPFFDQEQPQANIRGMIASVDKSPAYELDAAAVFDTTDHQFLVVFVSGCSCWPDRGSTTQHICARIVDVDRLLAGEWSELKEKCQANGWDSRNYYIKA